MLFYKTMCHSLRSENLATDRDSLIMKAANGSQIEVFESVSRSAIDAAHSNLRAQKMWEGFAKVCDFIPLSEMPETSQPFAEFSLVD